MSANTKSLRTRIKSVDSTLHLTKAMALVASSKVRRAGESMQHSRAYCDALGTVINALAASPECAGSPYFKINDTAKPERIIVIAGDRGLAGGYNNNVFKLVREYPNAELMPIGKRACDRYGGAPVAVESFGYPEAKSLAEKLCAMYTGGEISGLSIIYTKYHNVMTQEAAIRRVLPIERSAGSAVQSMIFEPDEQSVLASAVPEYVAGEIYAAVRESFACEVAARRLAMDSATDNAQVMKDELSLQYNRARQSAITQEITEIVAGR